MDMINSQSISQGVHQGDLMRKKASEVNTFAFITKEWLDAPSKIGRRKGKQYENYASKLVDRWGKKAIDQITKEDVEAFARDLAKQPGVKSTFMGPAAINNYAKVYTAIMNFAKTMNLVETFPHWKKLKENRNTLFISTEQIRTFVDSVDELRGDMFVFACHTGLRNANVRLLKRSYLSPDFRYVSFPAAVMKNGEPFEKALNDEARDIVVKHIRRGDALMKKFPWLDHIEHVFVQDGPKTNIIGKPFSRSGLVNKKWRSARKASGLPDNLVFHSGRHFMASTMIRNGVSMPVVQKSGGWGGPKSMHNYFHVLSDEVVQAADTTGSLL